MKKKAYTPITVFFVILVFIIGWALFFGKFLNDMSQSAITSNNLTGIEAFVLGNMNTLVFVCLLIFIMIAMAVYSGT